jgi:hypothetical protein
VCCMNFCTCVMSNAHTHTRRLSHLHVHCIFVSPEAKSDLVNVLSRLEAHWVVLEAELVEINKDITYCEQCVQKYGCEPACKLPAQKKTEAHTFKLTKLLVILS